MKLIIQQGRVVATATDDYTGPEEFMPAPADFEVAGSYVVADGVLTPMIPQAVTKRQARAALLLDGSLSLVQPAIDAITNPIQRGLMQIEWDDSQEYERQRPAVILIGTAIGKDAAALDALFIAADQL